VTKPKPNGSNGNGRDPSTGRFLPGNPGGPGNQQGASYARFQAVLHRCFTEEDFAALVGRVRELVLENAAGGGDWRFATKLLWEYLMGKPKETLEVKDDEAVTELRNALRSALKRPEVTRAIERLN